VKVTAPASVRKGPSASSAIIGIAHTSAEAQVVSREGDSVQIIDPDSKKTGWIQQSFLAPQTAPSSRPASQQEIAAALAPPAEDTTASADNEPYAKSRSHKHGWEPQAPPERVRLGIHLQTRLVDASAVRRITCGGAGARALCASRRPSAPTPRGLPWCGRCSVACQALSSSSRSCRRRSAWRPS
jgi:hypothetical protein